MFPRNSVFSTLCLLGCSVSAYLAVHQQSVAEFGSTRFFCNLSSYFNCDAIARQPWSEVYGVPIALVGTGYFLCLLSTGVLRRRFPVATSEARRVLTASGLVVCLCLGILADYRLRVMCIPCIAIYMIVALLALLCFYPTFKPSVCKRHAGVFLFLSGVFGLATGALQLAAKQGWHDPWVRSINRMPIDFRFGGAEELHIGSPTAGIRVTAFVDYHCPYCIRMVPVVAELAQAEPDDLVLVVKHFPLDLECNLVAGISVHPGACQTAHAIQCLSQDVPFAELSAAAIAGRAALSRVHRAAQRHGLSSADIAACRDDRAGWKKIQRDVQLAGRLGVDRTPTFFVNEHPYDGPPEELYRMLRERVKAAKARRRALAGR